MFDSEGNMIDVAGHIVVPSHTVNEYIAAMRRQQRPHASARGRAFALELAQPPPSQSASSTAPSTRPGDHQVAVEAVSPGRRGHNNNLQQHRNTYADALSPYSPATFDVWPQQHQHSSPAPVAGVDLADNNIPQIWLSGVHAQQSFAQNNSTSEESGQDYRQSHSLPPRSSATPTHPIIRVTADWPSGTTGSQPQEDAYPAAPASSQSPLNPYNSYATANMSYPYPMPQDPETMQTPVSPISADNHTHDHHQHQHHNMGDEQQISRKRSHSVMSQQDASLVPVMQHQNHSRAGSIGSVIASPNGVNDEFSPRGSRAFKRGDPPENAIGKYICTFSQECEGQTFDRKCEWSKHMDKHDRPYRCPHQQCAKLQGFTYSGGLLRHEREVHGKHGGPKAQLMCPHVDCKRHTGKGFTRKENLNEHLRRVHPSDKDSQNTILTRTATDGLLADEADSQLAKLDIEQQQQQQPHDEYALTSPAKRKRSIDGVLIEDPEREIKRLRAELAHRDHLIQQFEQDLMHHEETRRQLQELQELHHQNQQQQLQHQQHQVMSQNTA